MALLSQYTTPEEILAVDSEKLAKLLATASHGRFGTAKTEEIQQTAKNSFGLVIASGSFALIIRQYIEQIQSPENSVNTFDAEIARLLAGFDTQLTTITGVGPTLAAVIFSEIDGDISRFSFSSKLAAFAGVDPSVKQSGEFNGIRMKMSKGPSYSCAL